MCVCVCVCGSFVCLVACLGVCFLFYALVFLVFVFVHWGVCGLLFIWLGLDWVGFVVLCFVFFPALVCFFCFVFGCVGLFCLLWFVLVCQTCHCKQQPFIFEVNSFLNITFSMLHRLNLQKTDEFCCLPPALSSTKDGPEAVRVTSCEPPGKHQGQITRIEAMTGAYVDPWQDSYGTPLVILFKFLTWFCMVLLKAVLCLFSCFF